MTETRYAGVEFYAEKVRANSSKRTGTILIVDRTRKNGLCVLGIARTGALPVATWISPSHLERKCEPLSDETSARAIDPTTFRHVDAFEQSAEYRAEYVKAIRAGASPLQPALERDYPDGTKSITAKFYELYGA